MPSIRAPVTKKVTTLTVAVKCRPLTERERGRDIVRVANDKEVLVLDPDLSKDYLDRIQSRTKERKCHFDYAFGPECTNSDVYKRSISSVIAGSFKVSMQLYLHMVRLEGTREMDGKTYTMVGTQDDPGLMVLSLHTIFDLIKKDTSSDGFGVSCSYLEVYNEVIYDLLEKSSGHLELREDPVQGIIVAGLRCIKGMIPQQMRRYRGSLFQWYSVSSHFVHLLPKVQSADKILELLSLGNSRRKTESTEANDTSSRSHAVLEVTVTRKQRNKYRGQVIKGKLALVDLAGSERASETNNGGQKLRDGANINRSLLALANCINALGKQQKKGLAYVPYRNSKLTRILKDGLSGNSQTVMVATISPADNQYHHTVNTLKYADRAKEIKTHIQKNIGTIDTHVSDYQRMIDSLQIEVCRLKKELSEKESQLCTKPNEKPIDDEMSWLNLLSQETSENVQERINLQKAVFELEETNLHNRSELQYLDDAIAKQQAIEKDGALVQALRSRQQVILDNIRDNDEAGVNYQKEIEANEKRRCELQDMIEEAISNNGNKTYLRILSQYRLLGMANTELQFEIAMRDQVICNQREVHRDLWNLLLVLGLDEKQILDLAAKQGMRIEDWKMTPQLELSNRRRSLNLGLGRFTPVQYCPCIGKSFGVSCLFQQTQDFSSSSFSKRHWESARTICREEHHSSYYLMCHDHSPSAYLRRSSSSGHWSSGGARPGFSTPDRPPHSVRNSYPQMGSRSSFGEGCRPAPSFSADFQNKDSWNNVNVRHSVGTCGSEDPFTGVLLNHGGSARNLFGCSPSEQSYGSPSSNHVFPNMRSSNHPDIPQVLPTYATPGMSFNCHSHNSPPSGFV